MWSVEHYRISSAAVQFGYFVDEADDNMIPANTKRNRRLIITSRRRFDVIITCLLRFMFVGVYDTKLHTAGQYS